MVNKDEYKVNKKLSYRGQNALMQRDKKHKRNNNSEYILYLSVGQSRLAGRTMFSTCPFVRPSVCLSSLFVRSFVCYQLVNALRKRMNRFRCKLA